MLTVKHIAISPDMLRQIPTTVQGAQASFAGIPVVVSPALPAGTVLLINPGGTSGPATIQSSFYRGDPQHLIGSRPGSGLRPYLRNGLTETPIYCATCGIDVLSNGDWEVTIIGVRTDANFSRPAALDRVTFEVRCDCGSLVDVPGADYGF